MATKLQVYNRAILYCGEAPLADLSEERESRRIIDLIWDSGAVDRCLEEGFWKFATRSAKLEPDPNVTVDHGHEFAYRKPDDFVIRVQTSSDEYHDTPLIEFIDEGGYIFANIEPIYLRWVSNGLEYGNNLSIWPASFTEYVAAYIAFEACNRITSDKQIRQQVARVHKKKKYDAKNSDAIQDPTKFPAPGSWNTSRRGHYQQSRNIRNGVVG